MASNCVAFTVFQTDYQESNLENFNETCNRITTTEVRQNCA